MKLQTAPEPTAEPKRIKRTYAVGDCFSIGHGFKAKILRRIGDWILIEKRKAPFAFVGYEALFLRRYQKERSFSSGHTYLIGCEYLPSDEDFGTDGFAFPNEETARRRFSELSETEPEPAADSDIDEAKPLG